MELRRTANAGILLRLDDKEILLDGVCREVKPYSATPQLELDRLMARWPDAVAFTHTHEDHFDPAYAESYHAATGRMAIPLRRQLSCIRKAFAPLGKQMWERFG